MSHGQREMSIPVSFFFLQVSNEGSGPGFQLVWPHTLGEAEVIRPSWQRSGTSRINPCQIDWTVDKSSQLQQPKTWLGKVPNYYETNLWAVPRSEATRVCKSKHQNQYFQHHQYSFGNRRRNVSIISKPTIPSQFCTWQGGAQSSHTSHQIIFVHLKLNRKRYQDILFASYEHLRFPTKSKGLNKRGPRGPSKVGSLWRSNWRQCSCRVTRVTHVTPDGTWHNLLVLSRLAIEHKPDMIDPKQNLMAELDSKNASRLHFGCDALGKANAKYLHAMFTMRFIELLHFGTTSCYSTRTTWRILDTPEAVPNTIGHASSHHKAYQSASLWNPGSERQSQHKGSNEQGTTAKPDLIKIYDQRHIKSWILFKFTTWLRGCLLRFFCPYESFEI